MFEQRHQPLVPRHRFYRRVARNGALATSMILASLLVGVMGYHYLEKLPWLDSLLNASMILSSMGPVDPVKTAGGKVFASIYALFSGVWFISVAGVLFAPIAHRFLHRFHAEVASSEPSEESGRRRR